jgi:sulfur-oxidizing protein SoxY
MAGDPALKTVRRRALLVASAGWVVTLRPAQAQTLEPSLATAIRRWAGDAVPRSGRVAIDIAQLVENGNAVPVTVSVSSPMTAEDHVREIVLFNERNPQRDVARFFLSPVNGRAEVATRIRLATSQQLVALARMSDGGVWQQQVDVLVTLAACVEGTE